MAIQLNNHPEIIDDVMAFLARYLEMESDGEFYRGKLLIVEAHRIRVRK